MEVHPFRFLRNLGRSREIATVLLNYGFGDLVERLHLRRYLQWGRRLLFRKRAKPEPQLTRAQRIRMALETLGATFVKFGQVMSTRPDLVPPDVVEELSNLQENVPPFSSEQAKEILTAELGGEMEELFAGFGEEPLAAGSLAQVHRATHHDGTPLAVKVRRPDVVKVVERDLSLMFELARLIERHIPEAEIFDPVGQVNYFARTIRREVNFAREGRTLDRFARLFRNDATLYVPGVYWDMTTEAVLTMEYVEGCHIQDADGLDALPISRHDLAANGSRIFMKMAFELGVFHGDPHPGNIRVLDDGSIALLDYGMIGMLDDEKREQLVDLFLAITRQDAASAVETVQELGAPLRPLDHALLRADVRDFVDTYYGLSLERMDVGNLLTDFVGILSTHGIRCPPDLMLLVRALIVLEGAGREIDPHFNLAQELAPFVQRIVEERYSVRRMADRFLAESRTLMQVAHDIPMHASRSLKRLGDNELEIHFELKSLDQFVTELDRSSNRLVLGLVLAALIVASAVLIHAGVQSLWLSGPIFLLSSLLGIWLIYGIFRSGRV